MDDPRIQNLVKLMDVAVLRQRVHAANLANQSTPNYHARGVKFDAAFQAALAKGRDAEARAVKPEVVDLPVTGLDNDGNNVDVDREVTLASQNTLLYNAYISLFRGKMSLLGTAVGSTGG